MSDLLKVEKLSKGFGGRSVLREIGFLIEPGKVYGLLGRNGEGKTTLIRTIMGVIPRDAGIIAYKGRSVAFGSADYKREVGYIPEDAFFYGWMTVGGLLDFNGRFFPKWDPRRAADDMKRFSLDPAAKVRTLSRGQQLKLAFVAALAAGPELLLLDDPTSGLDVPTRRDFLRDVIRELAAGGTAVLFATHLVHELERIVDHLFILHGGRFVLDETYEKVKSLTRRAILGFDADPPEILDPGGVIGQRRMGKDVELTIYPWSEAVERTLRALNAARLEIEPLSLEDIFTSFVREKR
ncbi:MAG: ABC transporter ATP-binding protein [Candidatus Aminicenantes bacterium]|nr:ABC transporter ATP-binding protein [Candidatus Aminicenantes bacterium]